MQIEYNDNGRPRRVKVAAHPTTPYCTYKRLVARAIEAADVDLYIRRGRFGKKSPIHLQDDTSIGLAIKPSDRLIAVKRYALLPQPQQHPTRSSRPSRPRHRANLAESKQDRTTREIQRVREVPSRRVPQDSLNEEQTARTATRHSNNPRNQHAVEDPRQNPRREDTIATTESRHATTKKKKRVLYNMTERELRIAMWKASFESNTNPSLEDTDDEESSSADADESPNTAIELNGNISEEEAMRLALLASFQTSDEWETRGTQGAPGTAVPSNGFISEEAALRIAMQASLQDEQHNNGWQSRHDVVEPPFQLICPITLELMVDPVLAADGQTYERSAIERVFASTPSYRDSRSPTTGVVLMSKTLIPNEAIRSLCREFRAKTLTRSR